MKAVNTLARLFLDVRQRRRRSGVARDCGGNGVAARQRQTSSEPHDVLGNLSEIGNIELRQGQGSGLVEDHPVDLGDALDRIAGIEQHPGTKQRA